ncbi:MAG: B12-binding domain-containing radical SAM protein [Candidatus Caldarchaeum sp.]|nr:B12-binding domain-containing radical SAM protein [Candidatus Caldarchaeum sp.]
MAADLLLVFPYFFDGRSKHWQFPPLGLAYIASYVRSRGYRVKVLDCTFLDKQEAVWLIRRERARVVGVYSMLSMVSSAKELAAAARDSCEAVIAGGPMPSSYPAMFLKDFDVVVQGEGEHTVAELLDKMDGRGEPHLDGVKGLWLSPRMNGGRVSFTGGRPLVKDLDEFPFPARDLFDHSAYQSYYRRNFGYTMTSMVASRGCPFSCDFCWRPDYGRVYRVRSPENIVQEMDEVRNRWGYERIWFADELFIASKKHVIKLCEEIVRQRVDVMWECLSRVDLFDAEVANAMKRAGCYKVIFGLESGDDYVLNNLMNKKIKTSQSIAAVKTAKKTGMQVGAFFILGYPGENNQTMLKTIRLASTLPLDYFSMTVPYPLPGTGLYEKVQDRMEAFEWEKPVHGWDHKLLFKHDFSLEKLRYGIWKAKTQSRLRKKLGPLYVLVKPYEVYTDFKFKRMN